MQFAQRVRILDGDFRRELAAALAGADFLATGTAVHVTAAFEFDQIAAVAEHGAGFHEVVDGRFHVLVSDVDGVGCFSQERAATAANERPMPIHSRRLTFSWRKRMASGTVTTG